jgi:hypothetical protein
MRAGALVAIAIGALFVPAGVLGTTVVEVSPTVRLQLSGYLRQWLSLNLEDHPELGADGRPIGGGGELSMVRSSALLSAMLDTGAFSFTAIGRVSREVGTHYLDDLEDASAAKGLPLNLDHEYEDEELREAYLSFNLGPRWYFKLGRQQVVWGETDFFQAMDVVHGYDQSWRSVFEPENEEWRKPLTLANVEIALPELSNAVLQLIYRPPVDAATQMGNTFDLFGGRWAAQPNKGTNALRFLPLNYDHSRGDADDPSYGFRWSADAGPVNYSLAWFRTLSQELVVNSPLNPYGQAPASPFGEFVFPRIDIYGATATGFIGALDAVWRAEVAYMPDKPFNFGFIGDPVLAGLGGVVEKDLLRVMLGLDRPLRVGAATSSPGTLSFQLFDNWITDYDRDDAVVDFKARRKEHSVILTALASLNFRHDTVVPSFVVIYDPTYGGGAVIPAIEYRPGDHWRWRAEADLFFKSGGVCSEEPGGQGAGCAHLFGTFDNNDQFVVRVSYLF